MRKLGGPLTTTHRGPPQSRFGELFCFIAAGLMPMPLWIVWLIHWRFYPVQYWEGLWGAGVFTLLMGGIYVAIGFWFRRRRLFGERRWTDYLDDRPE